MSKVFEQKLSLLMDGEITPFETKRLVDEIQSNSHLRSLWLRMNKHKAAMHGELLDQNLDLSQKIMSQINKSTSTTKTLKTWPKFQFLSLTYMKACCYLIGFFFILSLPLFNLPSPSSSISSKQNILPLNNEALLVDLGAQFNGSLKDYRITSSSSMEANYLIPGDEKSVRLKVFFDRIPEQEWLGTINNGVTVHTKSGSTPLILNLSSENLPNQRLIKISNTFLEKINNAKSPFFLFICILIIPSLSFSDDKFLPNIAELVENTSAAVVNVSVTKTVKTQPRHSPFPGSPRGFPFDDFFNFPFEEPKQQEKEK